jgi:hypothetical protein
LPGRTLTPARERLPWWNRYKIGFFRRPGRRKKPARMTMKIRFVVTRFSAWDGAEAPDYKLRALFSGECPMNWRFPAMGGKLGS